MFLQFPTVIVLGFPVRSTKLSPNFRSESVSSITYGVNTSDETVKVRKSPFPETLTEISGLRNSKTLGGVKIQKVSERGFPFSQSCTDKYLFSLKPLRTSLKSSESIFCALNALTLTE